LGFFRPALPALQQLLQQHGIADWYAADTSAFAERMPSAGKTQIGAPRNGLRPKCWGLQCCSALELNVCDELIVVMFVQAVSDILQFRNIICSSMLAFRLFSGHGMNPTTETALAFRLLNAVHLELHNANRSACISLNTSEQR
jgi:hypothetical protein